MNKYITLHDTIDQRESVVLDYTNTPHVSYTGEDDKVEYTEYQSYITATYEIDQPGEINILGYFNNGQIIYQGINGGRIIKMIVDGEEKTPSLFYNFNTAGEHVVVFYFSKTVDTLINLFFNVPNLKIADFTNFDSKNITSFQQLFANPNNISNYKLEKIIGFENLDTRNVTTIKSMCLGCHNLTHIDVGNWNVSNIKEMSQAFRNCEILQSVGVLSNWDVSNVTTTYCMFYQDFKLKTIGNTKNWNLKNCTTCEAMFSAGSSVSAMELQQIDVQNWFINGKVEKIDQLFQGCAHLTSIGDISKWDVSSVTDTNAMFSCCKNLKYIGNLSNWNVSNVTNMRMMFLGCNSLKSIGDVSNWNVSNVTDFSFMFSGLYNLNWYNNYGIIDNIINLTSLGDITKWNTSKATTFDSMFQHNVCDKIYLPNIPKNANTHTIVSYGTQTGPWLKHIIKSGKISSSINFEKNPLTHKSALILIDALDPEVNCTLTLSSVTYNTLTDEEKKVATDKGWTIAVLN